MANLVKSLERTLKRAVASILRTLPTSRLDGPPAFDTVRRILVVRQHNQLGDMLCVVPLLRALRQRFPTAFIALLASPANLDVMLHNRYLDQVIAFDKRTMLARLGPRPGNLLKFAHMLRSHKFDLAIVPSTVSVSVTSDLLGYLSGARLRVGAESLEGQPNGTAFLFNLPKKLDWRETPHRHQTLRNVDVISDHISPPADLRPEITLLEDEREYGRTFVEREAAGKSACVVVHPGAGKAANRWPAERFAEVANHISEEFNALILLTCGPMDDGAVRIVESRLRVPYKLIRNQYSRSIASILQYANLLISNDTGIMHVGAAMETPVLSLFGPTDPEQWAPTGVRNRYIRGEGEDISTIPVQAVLAAARQMLRRSLAAGSGRKESAKHHEGKKRK